METIVVVTVPVSHTRKFVMPAHMRKPVLRRQGAICFLGYRCLKGRFMPFVWAFDPESAWVKYMQTNSNSAFDAARTWYTPPTVRPSV